MFLCQRWGEGRGLDESGQKGQTSSYKGLPDSSVGKEAACNAGDPSLIPGLARSAGEGNGYPLQYSGLENPMDCIGSQRLGYD